MPVEIQANSVGDSDFVCSVEEGINNAATASIVCRDGTVKARKFINPVRTCHSVITVIIAKLPVDLQPAGLKSPVTLILS